MTGLWIGPSLAAEPYVGVLQIYAVTPSGTGMSLQPPPGFLRYTSFVEASQNFTCGIHETAVFAAHICHPMITRQGGPTTKSTSIKFQLRLRLSFQTKELSCLGLLEQPAGCLTDGDPPLRRHAPIGRREKAIKSKKRKLIGHISLEP